MNIVVFGAGAIGSLYAAKLAAHHRVTAVARPAHAAAINQSGLRVTGVEQVTRQLTAVTALDSIPPDTLMLLTTKVNENRTVARAIAGLVRDDTTILCVQNGLGGEDIVKEAIGAHGGFGRSRARHAMVLRAITQFGAIFLEPGVIDYRHAGYTLIEQSPRSEPIAALFCASGLDGRISRDIKIEVWRKLIFNCVINPITTMIGAEVGAIADHRLDPLKQLVIDECLAVAGADGVRFEDDFLQTIATVYAHSHNIVSTRQDLLRHRATEIDFMNGAVAGLGRRFGIDCPVNAALVAIVKAMERAASAARPS